MQLIKKTLFMLGVLLVTLILSSLFFWMIILPGKKHLYWVSNQWIRFFLWWNKIIWQIDYQLEGLQNLPQNKPYILASKHQSLLETFIFFLHIPNFIFILKRELLWIPIWGWWLAKIGTIAINRRAGVKSLQKMLAMAEKFKQQNRAIIIYPEGTRTLPHQTAELKGGVAMLYQKLQIQVVPVALNSGMFYPKKGIRQKGTLTIKILPAIKTGLNKQEFMAQLTENIHQQSINLIKR